VVYVLTTDQKGAAAEAAIALAAIELGIGVYRPWVDERCDLILDVRPGFLRVQCKWTPLANNVIIVPCYRARRNADGLLRRFYTSDEVDAFAAYCPELRKCYLIPFESIIPSGQFRMRVGPTRNNQQLHVRWAKDYEFAATLTRLGAIAQLGERVAGSDEVAGSSPAGSTFEAAF
jgi:PD-(D/E)XK endonuclease